MAKNKGNSVGVTRKGIVVKDQGFVPYNDVKEEPTPDVALATSTTGKNRGMGDALRGGTFKIC
jgi:anti-sigma regulatory factor (Ser/Thr protein kinase)